MSHSNNNNLDNEKNMQEEYNRIRGLNIDVFDETTEYDYHDENWYDEEYEEDENMMIVKICCVGSGDLFEFLYRKKQYDDHTIGWCMRYACAYGHLQIAKFLWDTDSRICGKLIDVENDKIFPYSTLPIKQWLMTVTTVPDEHIVVALLNLGPGIWMAPDISFDHSEQFNWLFPRYKHLLSQEDLSYISKNMEVIKWIDKIDVIKSLLENYECDSDW